MDPWVELALEEYKTLRQESLAAIEQIQRTLQIGLVAIGVITGFGVQATKNGADVAVGIGLILAPPLLASLISVMGIEELRRAVDAGNHVARLERQVASRLGAGRPRPLTWETNIQTIRGEGKGFRTHWWRTCALFVAGIPAVVLGVVSLIRGDDYVALGLSGGAAVILLGATFWHQRRRHAELTKRTQAAVGP